MSGTPRINYHPREDVTPQAEAATLASIYRFVLDIAKQKAAAHALSNDPDDAKGFKDEKEKGDRYVKHLTDSPSGVDD